MTALQQAAYAWAPTPTGRAFGPHASTFSRRGMQIWHGRVERWLRTDPGRSAEPSHFYGVFDDEAVLVRRLQPRQARSARTWLLTGPATTLTPKLALELRDFGWLGGERQALVPLTPRMLDPYRAGLERQARAPEVLELLVPLLSRILAGAEGPLVHAPSPLTYALLWGLQDVLGGIAVDRPAGGRWQMSFETYDDRTVPPDHPGLFVRFQRGAFRLPVDRAGEPLARELVAGYAAADGRRAPQRRTSQSRSTWIPTSGSAPPTRPDPAVPGSPAGNRDSSGTPLFRPPGPQAASTSRGEPMTSPAPAPVARRNATDRKIICPICLSILDWDDPPLHRYDPAKAAWVRLTIPPTASANQRAADLRTAFVECRDAQAQGSAHYLPLAYGQHGPPAVYGLVGATRSGKTHLLTAMIGQLEKQGLRLGIRHRPIGLADHQTLIDEQVSPFLNRSKVIEQTRAGAVGLVDAFLIGDGDDEGDEGRPVALFDVAGGDLLQVESARRFLDIADGLIFVVNAAELGRDELGDRTFSTVLELLQGSGRLSRVSATVVLNKADLLRFEDPIARWMRQPDQTLDAETSLRESADVYAYLHAHGAGAWTRPYRECRRATLHVASAVGSDAVADGTFVRGVTSCRVLNPLISLMAMTGVLTSPEAKKIGI